MIIKMIEKNNIQEDFLKSLILLFLFFILIINPPNKLLFVLFIGIGFFLLKTKYKLFQILLLFFITTNYLPNGKNYFYQLHDLKSFPYLKEEYPLGLIEEIKITINDIFFIFIFFHFIRKIVIKKINPLVYVNKTILYFIIFLSFVIFSNIIISPNLWFSLYLNKNFLKILFIYFYIKINQKNISEKFILDLILIMIFFQSYLSLLQFFKGSPLGKEIEAIHNIEVFGKTTDEISFYYRPTGTFKHANFLGEFLFFGVSLLIYKIIFLKEKKFFNLINLIISIISLFLTLSRSAFYSLIIFLILLNLNYNKLIKNELKKINKKVFFVFLLFSPFLLISLYRFFNIFDAFAPSGGIYVRFYQLIETLKLISNNLLFGVGTGFSVAEAIKFNPYGVFASFPSPIHNFYLLLTVENGIFVITFFVLFLYFLLKDFLLKNKIFFFILISLMFYSFFQPVFFTNEIFFLYAIIINKNGKNFKKI